ncbi:uncharacterized protein PG986_009328, partial [Apiospora aurea]
MSTSLPPPVAKQPQPPRHQTREVRSPPPVAGSAARGGAATQSPSVEFRGFDFFAKREFNELKTASEAYFCPSGRCLFQGIETTVPGTGPGVGLPPAEGRFPIPMGGKNELPSLTHASDTWSRKSTTRFCGLRRSRFWMIIGLLIGLVIVVVAVGVGVGVGKNASGSASDAAGAVSSGPSSTSSHPTSTATTTATATVSPTSTSTTTSTNPAATAGKLDCPAANGTEYMVPGSNKSFLRVCGVDYTGASGGRRSEAGHDAEHAGLHDQLRGHVRVHRLRLGLYGGRHGLRAP